MPSNRVFQVPPEGGALEWEEEKTLPRLVTMATEEGNDGAGLVLTTTEAPTESDCRSRSSLERLEFRINRRERLDGIRPSFVIVTSPAREIPTRRCSRDLIWATCPARCAADSAFWLDERDMEMAWSDAIARR